jgi:GINS complex subunit 3
MTSNLSFSLPDGYDYYDLDSIMADEVTVPCTLLYGCTGIGQIIDPSSDTSTLIPNSKVELPLWMVPIIARRGLAQVQQPPFFGNRMRRKVKAGAACEDLKSRCAYFYTVALRVHSAMQATGSIDENFPGFIFSTFANRYRDLLAKAPTLDNAAEVSDVQSKLSIEELQLFSAASNAATIHERYRANKLMQRSICGSKLVKRKWGPGQENMLPSRG